MSPEVLFASGYAAALLGSAVVLEFLSAHTHRRALRFRTAGFDYQPDHDLWICPEGQSLWPAEFDRERRLVRYRGKAQICNACPKKADCTDSDQGREVVRPLDPWPHSEAGRFHRVIALLIVAAATLILVVEVARNHAALELILLGGLLTICLISARWLLRDLGRHPANFPPPTPSQGLGFTATNADGTPVGRKSGLHLGQESSGLGLPQQRPISKP
jgi:hypothetical protein